MFVDFFTEKSASRSRVKKCRLGAATARRGVYKREESGQAEQGGEESKQREGVDEPDLVFSRRKRCRRALVHAEVRNLCQRPAWRGMSCAH